MEDDVGVGALVVTVICETAVGEGEVEVEVEGPVVVWVISDADVKLMVADAVWEGTTEESVRLEFCPGNVRTGS